MPAKAVLPHGHLKAWLQLQIGMPMPASILGQFGKPPRAAKTGSSDATTSRPIGRRRRQKASNAPESLQVCLLKWRPWIEEDNGSVAASRLSGVQGGSGSISGGQLNMRQSAAQASRDEAYDVRQGRRKRRRSKDASAAASALVTHGREAPSPGRTSEADATNETESRRVLAIGLKQTVEVDSPIDDEANVESKAAIPYALHS